MKARRRWSRRRDLGLAVAAGEAEAFTRHGRSLHESVCSSALFDVCCLRFALHGVQLVLVTSAAVHDATL